MRLNADSVKSKLLSKGWNQIKFAKEMDTCPEVISKWMNGKSLPREASLLKISKLLGIAMRNILCFDED